jgi:hypothetical protein
MQATSKCYKSSNRSKQLGFEVEHIQIYVENTHVCSFYIILLILYSIAIYKILTETLTQNHVKVTILT